MDVASKAIAVLDYLETTLLEQDTKCLLDIERPEQEALQIIHQNSMHLLNVRSSLSQIWLSSPLSGPSHFNYHDAKWTTSKGLKLEKILSNEISELTGMGFVLMLE
jgi:frataxin-like iron-binding protein CyaY